MYRVIRSEFKGHQLLEFHRVDPENPDRPDRWAWSLGRTKLQAILEHLDEVKAFVQANGEEPAPPPAPSAPPAPKRKK